MNNFKHFNSICKEKYITGKVWKNIYFVITKICYTYFDQCQQKSTEKRKIYYL